MKEGQSNFAKVVAGSPGAGSSTTTMMGTDEAGTRKMEEDAEDDKKKAEIVKRSRRTVGFEKGIEIMFKENYGDARNIEEAKLFANREFLSLEMKINDKMDIVKVFATRHEGANIL